MALRVRRQVQRAGGGAVEIRPPKCCSERVAFLLDELLAQLVLHLQRHAGDDPDAWAFAAPGADPPHQNTVGHQGRGACRRAGVSGVTLHDLRKVAVYS